MRILVLGDSVAAGEWCGMSGNWPGTNHKLHVSHLGLSQYLHDAGHIVAQWPSPGRSNYHSISHLAGPNKTWGEFSRRKDKLTPRQFGPEPFLWPTHKMLGIGENEPWHHGIDIILFFWTGPLRSWDDFLPAEAFYHKHKDKRVTMDELMAYHDMCAWTDLSMLDRYVSYLDSPTKNFNTQIWMIGGQSDLPHILTVEENGLNMNTLCESFVGLVWPEISRPKVMDTMWALQNQLGVSQSKIPQWKQADTIKLTQKHMEKIYENFDLDVVEMREQIFEMWARIQNTQGAADAHPDRHAHKILFDLAKTKINL